MGDDLAALYRRYLGLYDALISIHPSPQFAPYLEHAQRVAREVAPQRVIVVDSQSVSAGLAAMALRAAEIARTQETPDAVLHEIQRLQGQGSFLLVSGEPERLRQAGWLPPGGDLLGRALSLWALFTLRNGQFLLPPLPVPQQAVPLALAQTSERTHRKQRVRAHIAAGEVPKEHVTRLERELRRRLNLEGGVVSPLSPEVAARTGPRTLVTFTYPI